MSVSRWVLGSCLALVGCGGGGGGGDAAVGVDLPSVSADVDERPPGCGAVPRGYACEGTQLRYCEDNVASTLDCARHTGDAGACREVSPRHGSFCVAPEGAPCRMAVAHGSHDHIHYAHCEGDGLGCLIRVNGRHELDGVCAPGFGACDPAAPSRCEGHRLVVRCEREKPVAYDCASYGGTCDPALLTCVGVAESTRCGANFHCREGLTCRPLSGVRGVSTCQR